MRVALAAPDWGNSWIPIFNRLIVDRGWEYTRLISNVASVDPEAPMVDTYLHMWAKYNPYMGDMDAQHIVFMRRYEFFDDAWRSLPWGRIPHLCLCSTHIKDQVDEWFKTMGIGTETHLIYNVADPEMWTFKERVNGKKIGMTCHIHMKKNLPLALQILTLLPNDYELHLAGAIQDIALTQYLITVAEKLKLKLKFYGRIPYDSLDGWWDDKNYCLSTSLSEGNPNTVIEAMAKGIKPVVHGWPGAEDQFGSDVFYTATAAASAILGGSYNSGKYKEAVDKNYSVSNYNKVIKLIKVR